MITTPLRHSAGQSRRKGSAVAVVDPTVWGLGRYILRMQRIAAQTPVNIIVAAGLYVYEELPQQYAYRGPGRTPGSCSGWTASAWMCSILVPNG